MSTVSVIIPAHNAERCLAECLDSVFAQRRPPEEVVVVNDGSDDGTGQVVEPYKGRIRYVEQANAGQGAARNAGLAHTSSDYIAFLDADDFWLPEFLDRTVAFLDEHGEAAAVSCAFRTRLAGGRTLVGPPCVANGEAPGEPVVLDDFFAFWAREDHVRTGTVLIRRRTVERAGGQCADLRISQDLEYWGYLATFGPWGFIPQTLWVGNSRAHAVRSGWLRRYRRRRKLCPSIEQWERRIVPRLDASQVAPFGRVRGRVAAGYAHHMILGGRYADARDVVLRYGQSFPPTPQTKILRLGARSPVGWLLACALVCARERGKVAVQRVRMRVVN